ncbi:MAG: molybdopterin-dependent oxidoreductase [Pseudomonadota bacterium]
MAYTASHWGSYELDGNTGIKPIDVDPRPSRIGRGWVSAARDQNSRILTPAVRKGWLDGDGGTARCDDTYVALSWDQASALVARELTRIKTEYGNGALFAGSYGWASAGRFHHAQSQMRRFLNLAGGFVSSRDTYSHGAAEVLWPFVLGMGNQALQDQMTSLSLVAEHCELLLAFGGISERTAQVASSGTTTHDVGPWLERLHERGARVVNISPRASDYPGAEWVGLRPGTDTALILALAHNVVTAGAADTAFLERYTSGWPEWRAYLLGETDGQPKTAAWAAPICDIDVETIHDLANALMTKRSMISMTWGMQRADHGEQTIWAGLGLACILGHIGQPGLGYAFGYGSTTSVGRPCRYIPWPSMPAGKNGVADFIPVARITDMLLKPGAAYTYAGETRHYPDIKMIYWVGGNPYHHHQDLRRLEQAWTQPQTVVVHETCWTATARRADIVLPATTSLERADLMMNRRDTRLLYMSPLMAPQGEALCEFDIFSKIAAHMGLEDAFTEGRDEAAWLGHLWARARKTAEREGFILPDFDAFKAMGRVDLPPEEARRDHIALRDFVADPIAAPLRTESGKITLFNARIDSFDLADCPGHPSWLRPAESLLDAGTEDALQLISPQPDTRLHSQNDRGSEAQSDKIKGREPAYMHPDTARSRGLAEGDIVRLWNARGACLAGLRFDPAIRRDCISLATGAWYDPQQLADGTWLEVHGNPNAVTLDQGSSGLSQANIAHTCLVRIEKWDAPLPALRVNTPPPITSAPVDL